jgi:hypothetical protein
MQQPQIENFEDFWPYYVKAHRKPLRRALHLVGTTGALACVAASVLGASPLWLLAAPVVGYGPAWIGHFAVEGNRPATFGHAAYSLRGDFRMLALMLRGKMANEVQRVTSV